MVKKTRLSLGVEVGLYRGDPMGRKNSSSGFILYFLGPFGLCTRINQADRFISVLKMWDAEGRVEKSHFPPEMAFGGNIAMK